MLRKQILTVSLAAAVIAGCATVAAQASQDNDASQRNALKEQLEVMNSILTTKLEQNKDTGKRRMGHWQQRRLNYDYLAGQGVVYRVKFGRAFDFDFEFDFDVDAPHAPGVPIPPATPNVSIEKRVIKTDDGEDVEIIHEPGEAYEMVAERGQEVGERTLAVHEYRRKIRDLEYSLQATEANGREKLEQELETARKDLEAARSELDAAKEQLRTATLEIRNNIQERREQRNEKLQQQVAEFEQTMAETLCDYGVTLKSLPNNESVSFVLEGAGNKDAGGRNKIYIFSKSSLSNCQGNDGVSDLLAKAVTYSF
ncbi:hypothetical protein [Pseudidiomarina gelatinasegens]|uniref:hypothetical protein n=1 Tax=Pseudidiomarina gelatinasegens TaxID=2487740 RepID=UPI0030EE2A0A|tara:strand:+ start:1269 stop:2204 length:936 start_codon:yes stop_codon:yes gene_type:complete